MQFGHPTNFWLLALVPVLVLFLVWAFRARRRALERFAAPPLADSLAASVSRVARRWKAVLLVSAMLFGLVALTQPRWGFEWREVKRKGVDIFVLLDVSKSMLTEDVRPNRLAQAKFAVEDLVGKLQGDRIGLIAFAGTAFVQCPLTVDYDAFKLTLNDADPRTIPRGGTAIGLAIQTALKAFETSEGRDHVILLITDGEDTEGDPLAAADEAAKKGVHIYTIGVGTDEGELIPVREDGKSMEFLKDQDGKVVKSRLNMETLDQIAAVTHGIPVRSAAGDFGLDTIYERGILQLRREEYEARLQKQYFERFQWPLGLAFVLMLMEMFVTDRRREERVNGGTGESEKRQGGKAAQSPARPFAHAPIPSTARLLLWALFAFWVSAASADTASRLYGQARYAEAYERYKKAAEREKDNWPLFYDLGAAAYKTGRPDEAAKAFERATGAPDRMLQARSLYNLGNSYFRIGEVAEQKMPQQAMPNYERSLKSYESALAIDPNDADAKFNLDVVKKKIEELKKQQEQQQQQQQNQKNQQDKDQNKEPQQQNQQPPQPQSPKPDEKQGQQPENQQPHQGKEQQQQTPQASGGQTNDFAKMQAQMLLDNLREEERNWNFFPEILVKTNNLAPPAKDW